MELSIIIYLIAAFLLVDSLKSIMGWKRATKNIRQFNPRPYTFDEPKRKVN